MVGVWDCVGVWGDVERYVPGSSQSGWIPVTASSEHGNEQYKFL